jgi:hypothetical protein
MKIDFFQTTQVVEHVEVGVTHKGKEFTLCVKTIDGKVQGDAESGIATSYLSYFDENSLNTRQKHFDRIKKIVENKQK